MPTDTIGPRRAFMLLSFGIVTAAFALPGCGGSKTPNEKVKPADALPPEEQERQKAIGSDPKALELQKQLEEAKKPKPKSKSKGFRRK